MIDKQNIQNVIEYAINLAAKIERQPSDIEYRYIVIGDDLLFAIRSSHHSLRQRVENIIMDRLYKQTGYHFQLVYPDPAKENRRAFNDARYVAKSVDMGIDPRHTIDKWNIFGKPMYIDAKLPVCSEEDLPRNHVENLINAGYKYSIDASQINTFEEYCGAYLEVYGYMPVDGYLKEKAKIDGAK